MHTFDLVIRKKIDKIGVILTSNKLLKSKRYCESLKFKTLLLTNTLDWKILIINEDTEYMSTQIFEEVKNIK